LKKLKLIFYEQASKNPWPVYVRFVNIGTMIREDKNRWFEEDAKICFS